MNIETAVIPIAGLGTRLLPVSSLVAKEFLPLGRKPAIQHIAEELADAGISRIVFVASPRKSQVAQLFGDNELLTSRLTGDKAFLKDLFWSNSKHAGVEIEICIQKQQLGLGHAIQCAEKSVGGMPFAVALGDCLIGLPGQSNCFQKLIHATQEQKADLGILFEQISKEKIGRYGIARIGDRFGGHGEVFELADIVEKPRIDKAPSDLAVCGRYTFSNEIFDWLRRIEPGKNGELQLTDAIAMMIKQWW